MQRIKSVESFGRQKAAKFGLNRSINIKCKNMNSYDVIFSVDRPSFSKAPSVVLAREPATLPGGANLATSIFRDPHAQRTRDDATPMIGSNAEDWAREKGFKSLHYEHMREWLQE